MTNNKILLYFSCGVILTSCFLTGVAVGWEDHPDVAIIDHFFDFHVDYDRIVEDGMQERANKEQRQRDYDSFVDGVRNWPMDEDCSAE